MVLSAGSHLFSDIFKKTNHFNMLIYLKGISSAEIEPVVDFLYNGEAFVDHDYVKTFLGTAKELQVKGLSGEFGGICENAAENLSIKNQNIEHDDKMMNSENKSIKNREIHLDPLEEFSFDTNDCSLVKTEEIIHTSNTKKGIALQIDRIIEKDDGLWICKVCGKSTLKNTNIRTHAERHIEGVSYTC